MVEVIVQKNPLQKTRDFFMLMGMRKTVGLAFVLILGGGFIATYTLLFQRQDIRQRAAEANALYVAPNGNDSNLGTIDAPLQTIQKCAQVVTPGYSCIIRAGTYRETVIPQNSGTSTQSITFKPYPGEQVVISGTDIVSPSSWALDSGSVYKAPVSTDLGPGKNQVFVDGAMLNEARWPNSGTNLFQPTFATADSATGSTTTATGSITAAAIPQIPGGWTGAYVNQMGPWEWNSYTGQVTSSNGSIINFKIITPYLNVEQYPAPGEKFYLYGIKGALDTPGEWFLDSATHSLYLWHPQSVNPSTSTVEVKSRTYGFDLSGKSYITIQGIKFFATSINTDSASTNDTLDGIFASYITHYSIVTDVWTTPDSGIQLKGTNNTIKNSEISYSAGNGIWVEGSGHTITNNSIHDVDYVADANAAIRFTSDAAYYTSSNITITNNTLYNSGKALIEGETQHAKILHNEFYNAGLLNRDLGLIYMSGDSQGTEIAYNKIHDNKAAAYGVGIYLESWNPQPPHDNQNVLIHHNAIWNNNWASIQINRNAKNIQIYNNTLWNDTIASIYTFSLSEPSTLTNIQVYNNILNHGFSAYPTTFSWSGVDKQNNLDTTANPGFVDAANNNYQLTSTSPAINAGIVIPGITDGYSGSAPDEGAYEYGATPWTAGYVPLPATPTPTPTTPIPTNTLIPTSTPTPVPSLVPTATPTLIPSATPTPTSLVFIAGDINRDNKVNVQDLSYLLSHWGTTDASANLNGAGNVDIFDLSILLSNWKP